MNHVSDNILVGITSLVDSQLANTASPSFAVSLIARNELRAEYPDDQWHP